jgi:hypothetical protein
MLLRVGKCLYREFQSHRMVWSDLSLGMIKVWLHPLEQRLSVILASKRNTTYAGLDFQLILLDIPSLGTLPCSERDCVSLQLVHVTYPARSTVLQ